MQVTAMVTAMATAMATDLMNREIVLPYETKSVFFWKKAN